MRAAVFYGRGDIRVQERADPRPGPGEVVVKVLACGICGTDVHEFAAGPSMFPVHRRHPTSGHLGPMIPGHELAGEVVETAPGVTRPAVGDLVACAASSSCGTCHWCALGRTNLCEHYSAVGLHRDGGLAQYCAVPATTCLPVDGTGLTPDAAALAQPMAIAAHARARSRLSAGEDALVVGAGGIGAFVGVAAAAVGATVCIVDPDDARVQVAANLGIPLAFRSPSPEALPELLAEQRFVPDVVFEASGTTAGLDAALVALRPGARLVVVGLQSRSAELDLRTLTLGEVEIIGTNALICHVDLPEAVLLLARDPRRWGAVAPEALPLADVVEDGIEPMVRGRSNRVKTLVDPWAEQRRCTKMIAP